MFRMIESIVISIMAIALIASAAVIGYYSGYEHGFRDCRATKTLTIEIGKPNAQSK